MNGIDPKWVFYLGILVTIEQGIGQGAVKLTNVVPEAWAASIIAWCTLLAFVGNVIMTALAGYSSKAAGPLVKPVIILVIIVGSLFAFTGEARAQQPKLTGNIVRDIQNVAKQADPAVKLTGDPAFDLLRMLDAKLLPDLQYAKALADANGNKLTSDCWAAWIAVIQTNENAVKNADGSAKDPPDPHLVTTLERAIDIRNALQPSAPFMVACSPVANLIKTDVRDFIGQVVGGSISLTKLVPLL